MKRRIYIILLIVGSLIFCSGITYSIFHSNVILNANDQNIAKFIFNAENLDQLELSLVDLNPGDIKDYFFAVSNSNTGSLSDVLVEYQMTLTTYHLVPLSIELYKLNGEDREWILTCDESYTRNEQNKLICNTPIQMMGYTAEELDNYVLRLEFPNEYNDEMYANLVDFINIEIKSWQKVEEGD
jgi:hypothetical protein